MSCSEFSEQPRDQGQPPNEIFRDIKAQVRALSANSIELRPGFRESCSACASGKGCGGGIFARLLMRKQGNIVLPLNQDLKSSRIQIGAHVRLRMPVKTLNRIAFWTWGAPVVALLAAASVIELFEGVGSVTGAVLLFALGLLAPRYAARELVASSLELIPEGACTGEQASPREVAITPCQPAAER